MPVEFYIHNEKMDIQNERRAICYVARQLQQRYQKSKKPYLLIANIDPNTDPEMREYDKITQLEGILIGQHSLAILEFKNYFDPVYGFSLNSYWFIESVDGRQTIQGGSKKNPYLQGKHARQVWTKYIRQKSRETLDPLCFNAVNKALNHVSFYLLFHPYLNKKSTFPDLGPASNWFYIRGIRAILELTYTVRDKDTNLTLEDMQQLAVTVLHAKPWDEMYRLLNFQLGHICVHEAAKPVFRYPIYCFQEFSIGRSSSVEGHQVSSVYNLISGVHAEVMTTREDVFIRDLNSSNGTYVNQQELAAGEWVKISTGDRVYLGENTANACVFWYEPLKTHATGETKKTVIQP